MDFSLEAMHDELEAERRVSVRPDTFSRRPREFDPSHHDARIPPSRPALREEVPVGSARPIGAATTTPLDPRPALTGSAALCQPPPGNGNGGGKVGKKKSIEVWLKELRPALLKQALRICKDKSSAEDAVQDLCERALTRADMIVEKENVPGFLSRTLVNCIIDRWRRERPDRLSSLGGEAQEAIPAPAPEPERPFDQLTIEDISRAIDRLPPDLREICKARFLNQIPHQRIAERFNTTTGAVGGKLFRAKQRLREILFPRRDGEED